MARYSLQIETHVRRKKLFWGRLQLLLGGIVLLLYLLFDEKNIVSRVAHVILALFFVSNGVSGIKALRRDYYVEINDVSVEWLPQLPGSHVSVVIWDDIRWIKQENNGSITFSQQSSFSDTLWLTDFSTTNKLQILSELYSIALARQIRLVNFGSVSSPVA